MQRALRTFAVGVRVIPQGTELPDGDPLVKGRERLFETVSEPVKSKPKRGRGKAGPKGDEKPPADGGPNDAEGGGSGADGGA